MTQAELWKIKADISRLRTEIANLQNRLEAASDISAVRVAAIRADLTAAQADIVALEGRMTTAEADIAAAEADILTNAGNVATNVADIATNVAGIAANTADITSNDGDITALDGRLTTAEGNITSNDGDITALDGRVTTAESDITSLEGDMTTAQSDINAAEADIVTNAGNISTNTSNISSNDGDITTLQGQMSTAQSDITAAEGDISTLQSDMTTAESDIDDLEAIPTFYNHAVGYTSLDYITNSSHSGNSVNQVWPTGFVVYTPLCVTSQDDGSSIQIDRLGGVIQTAGSAGNRLRAAIYTNANGRPKTLVVETAVVATNVTGLAVGTITATTLAPGWHWLALQDNSGNPVYYGQRSLTTLNVLGNPAGVATPITSFFETYSFAAFPATAGTLTAYVGVAPLIQARVV